MAERVAEKAVQKALRALRSIDGPMSDSEVANRGRGSQKGKSRKNKVGDLSDPEHTSKEPKLKEGASKDDHSTLVVSDKLTK